MKEFKILEPGQVPEIVYGLADEAAGQEITDEGNIFGEDSTEFLLNHQEEPHLNRGRAEIYNPEIPEELQVRRPGGGGSVPHHNTVCWGVATPKTRPKEGIKDGLRQLGKKLEKDLQNLDYNASYYKGDIYLEDGSQAVGLGAFDAGDAAIFRGCFYRDYPEDARELIEADGRSWQEYTESIEPVPELTEVLQNGSYSTTSNLEFGGSYREKAAQLQEKEGFRQPYHCFTEKQTELKK